MARNQQGFASQECHDQMNKREPLIIYPISTVPLIQPGDNLPEIIHSSINNEGLEIRNNDVLVVTQKIVSKAENRFVNVNDIAPSKNACLISRKINKDPRLVEIILQESHEVIRTKKNTIIVEHYLGCVCANAGVDHSNIENNVQGEYLLLPKNPDQSAQLIRDYIKRKTGKQIGVLIIDSQGRAWRNGIVGTTIGVSGFPAVIDMRGEKDLFGFELQATQIAAADEVAAAASIIMGQADEKIPLVIVRGFPYLLRDSNFQELIRPKEEDLFR